MVLGGQLGLEVLLKDDPSQTQGGVDGRGN